MDINETADITGRGASDISGVKEPALDVPDVKSDLALRDADGDDKTAERSLTDTDMITLEAEFDELIGGRFREVYKRRTEGIIRKRLKSVKARTEASDVCLGAEPVTAAPKPENAVSEVAGAIGTENEEVSQVVGAIETADEEVSQVAGAIGTADEEVSQVAGAIETPKVSVGHGETEAARVLNRSRPIENGLGGSCGVVSKINVSALTGRDVISILKRVGTGEKISFK